MNPHWSHDAAARRRLARWNSQEPPANDDWVSAKVQHRSSSWKRLRARLKWSPARWQEWSLVVIVYGGLLSLWTMKQAGVFDFFARMLYSSAT
jgi:hypothetical protein